MARSGHHAVIMAGGQGIRLRPYTTVIPKPLVPIGSETSILEIILLQLRANGFESVTLAIGHLGRIIRAYVGDGSQWGMKVDFQLEETPLGTMGPLLEMRDRLPERFLVMNGDVLTDLSYRSLMDDHIASDSDITVATYERQVKIDFGVLRVDGGQVVGFSEKPTLDYSVSMGVYGMSRRLLDLYTPGKAIGFDTLMLDRIGSARPPRSYKFSGYWLDIGRPDDYDQAQTEFVARRDQLLPLDATGLLAPGPDTANTHQPQNAAVA
jgi:NDP-sugar pyrophosphorylase family protein